MRKLPVFLAFSIGMLACDRGQRDDPSPAAASPAMLATAPAPDVGPSGPRPSPTPPDAGPSRGDVSGPTPDAASARNHCERGPICTKSGNCVVGPNGRCLPSVEGCEASENCAELGMCAPTETLGCRPSTDEHCKQSSQCARLGRCVLGPEQRCLTSDEACAASEDCEQRGACIATDDLRSCQPVEPDHCEQSKGCALFGRCTVYEIPHSRNLCRASCDYDTLQQVEEHRLDGCMRRADQPSCRELEVCTKLGLCEERGTICVRTSVGGCRSQEECRTEGRCHGAPDGDWCEAALSDDCRASTGCKEHGRCSAFDGQCITDAEVEAQCGPGHVIEDGHCYRAPGYDCKKECAEWNRCRPKLFEQRFVVCIETAEYCRNHVDCRQKGLCGVNERRLRSVNKCSSESDSPFACEYWSYGGCVKTEADCPKSVDCAKYGRCSAHTLSSYCRPTRAEHCQKSEICKNEGQCRLLDESSYYICGD